jgi:hypothetical protein
MSKGKGQARMGVAAVAVGGKVKRAKVVSDPHFDLGSESAIAHGVVEVLDKAHIPVSPDDKATRHVTGRRAQRVWAPRSLAEQSNPAVTPEGLMAAERLLNDWLVSEYGASAGQDGSGIRVDAWSRLPFVERRAMCRQSFWNAMRHVTYAHSSLIFWTVLQESPIGTPPTVAAWREAQPDPKPDAKRVAGMLGTLLDVLAVHYGFAKPSPATIVPERGGV